ncbi:MAG: nucleoside kinase, partial [Acholeplasmataceae bacterium]
QINQEVNRIVSEDYKIERHKISLDKAIELYHSFGMEDKVDILKYREEKDVNYYACNDYINYMFGYMLPSTGYLKKFKMFVYYPGFIIQYPRAELNGNIPDFIEEPSFGKALKDSAKWGKVIDGNTLAKINRYAENKKSATDFVSMCESKHSHMLHELGDQIEFNIDSIKLICIAGPSSSGKTTFSNRLRIELLSRGIHPVMISIDDYYLGKQFAPKDDFGQPDLEHVQALDLELFNHDMSSLIQGETITLPKFNFKTGLREKGQTVHLKEDTPIIIEGIHALNEQLTYSIPKHQKYKIYISPQTQLHIDDLNPISITELRLLRRIVRDQKYRNSSAADTMKMWANVRKGEFKWIYPFQNEADYIFNSELTYELAVLKKHAISQLLEIDHDNVYFITANRLLKFLKYIKDIDDDLVPNHSLLREFIGDSCFNY